VKKKRNAKINDDNKLEKVNGSYTGNNEMHAEKKAEIAEVVEDSALAKKEEQPQLIVPEERTETHVGKKKDENGCVVRLLEIVIKFVFMILEGIIFGR